MNLTVQRLDDSFNELTQRLDESLRFGKHDNVTKLEIPHTRIEGNKLKSRTKNFCDFDF